MVMFLTGEDITAIRKALGLNLRQFGELLSVTEATVCRWESQTRRPRYDDMERLNNLAAQHSVRVPSQRLEPARV